MPGHHVRRRFKRSQALVSQARDRDCDICQCCGCGDGSEVHHIEPLFLGGKDELNNLICLCTRCHDDAPDNPKEFFKYQRAGGSLWSVAVELIKSQKQAHQKLIKDVESKDYEEKLRLVDELRLKRWGWLSGRDVAISAMNTGEISPEDTVELALERLERVSFMASQYGKASKKRQFNISASSIKATLENIEDHSEELKDILRRHIMDELTEYAEEIRKQLKTAKENCGEQLNHLSSEMECAVEDIFEAIDRHEKYSCPDEKGQYQLAL